MNHKKLIAGLLCLFLLISLTACGEEEAVQSSASKTFTALTSAESTETESQVQSQTESQSSVSSAAGQSVSSAPAKKESTAAASSTPPPDSPKEEKKTETSKNPAIYCTFILKTHEETLLEGTVELLPKDTAYSVLVRVCGEEGIAVKKRGSDRMGWYIEAVNGLKEGDMGGTSGWKYEVNGIEIGKGCDKQAIKENDILTWKYALSA